MAKVVYVDWRDRQFAPEIIGVYMDETQGYETRELKERELVKEGYNVIDDFNVWIEDIDIKESESENSNKTIKISSINMKETCDAEIYYRLLVKASELPKWMYLKAKEMDEENKYLLKRDEQYFEIEGYFSNNDNKINDLKLVYYWDEYEIITELDINLHGYIYKAVDEFINKYGDKIPDNGELMLGDCEYVGMIPQYIKDEWENLQEEN